MTTFSVRVPRFPVLIRLRGRDPLVRTTDRIEALILVLAVVMALVAIPIAGAVGTAVHDSRRDLYAGQAANRSLVVATVTDAPESGDRSRIGAVPVSARWSVGGIDHVGTIAVPSTVNAGDPMEIWVDTDGAWVTAPTSTTRAALDAVAAALLIVMGAVGAAATLVVLTRTTCNRIRSTRWQEDLDSLVGHGLSHP